MTDADLLGALEAALLGDEAAGAMLADALRERGAERPAQLLGVLLGLGQWARAECEGAAAEYKEARRVERVEGPGEDAAWWDGMRTAFRLTLERLTREDVG